ncbi:uncharacterized protein LOC106649405 [Trichogramma pretiosum]|uniref:uncharacterized protein LOC106649405 n=1 Tax=Trichogramma pretiosum TaxID=7493 RepID=UPI0006C9BA16|nr:uncharacterized protein LOC106649405 [Trichogramma pretiosum]XP_014222275.1 uncharacterized protein LOC106649405 [Trichogramma pretiosum]
MSAVSVTTHCPTGRDNRGWCAKTIERQVARLRRVRNGGGVVPCGNRVDPGRVELPGCEFFQLAPDRVLRVLRPELKSASRYYEPRESRRESRPESLADNFYSRWQRRPHPLDNCRCSFRQSLQQQQNKTKTSVGEQEAIISQEIARIRTSLCEAERSGLGIEELEKSIAVDRLTQLEALPPPCVGRVQESSIVDLAGREQCRVEGKIEPLDDQVKKRIVKGLDKYISDLLDEILDDTIRALARSDDPFDRSKRKEADDAETTNKPQPAAFDISFAFHEGGDKDDSSYVNRGFVVSDNDPETLDFHLRSNSDSSDNNNDNKPAGGENSALDNPDYIDSGINSVETIELQSSSSGGGGGAEQLEHNLEQSLIDIIDAKLGGASIGKSLEDLGMEIDEVDDVRMSQPSETPIKRARTPKVKAAVQQATNGLPIARSDAPEKKTITDTTTSSERGSKCLDELVEEQQPPFNSLRLEFKRRSGSSGSGTGSTTKGPSGNKDKTSSPSHTNAVTSRVNKTVSVIRQRLVMRLGKPRRKQTTTSPTKKSSQANGGQRSSLELEDYRRRFPVPEHRQQLADNNNSINKNNNNNNNEMEVTLRKNRHRKPILVFLHGFGSSADTFEPQLRYFSNLGYPCIAPELLGHGMSTASRRAKDYRFLNLLKDLETVLLYYAFKPGQKCVIIAHNYGCSFASALASKYQSYVQHLILISGGGPTCLAPPTQEGACYDALRALVSPFVICGLQRSLLYGPRGRQHPYCGYEADERQRPSHMRHVLRGMSWPEGDYVFHRRINTPTLLIHGLRDDKVSLVQECQMERTMIKAFLEAIPAAGHMPMTDCPEQLNHMIHCFIDLWKNKKW